VGGHADTRVAALQLLMRGPMRGNKHLIDKAIPLLRDPQETVRRAVLVVLATENEQVREEDFLHLLHDEDAEVQYLCEMALRKRGLTDADITLARLISDENPSRRMLVLHHFRHMSELNLNEWLRRLSVDPSPAVRAAAVRAVGENLQVDLSPRLREMAERDPSETVRQNAQYYLQQRALRTARD
jgi:HEAT repeat protein